nr:immunoglobulin light chain junction region [Macaca mulatta]
CFQALDFPWTF